MLKKAVQQGRSERESEAYIRSYVEGLSDARTPLAAFFSIPFYSRSCPLPNTMNLEQVSSSNPIGPRAWTREVLIPISAPNPN